MRVEASNTADEARLTRRPTVLLVEDELGVRESLGRFLEANGYEVLTAADVDHAFELLGFSSVEALILDVRFPGDRSGLEVLEFARLNEDWADVPAVILTAFQLNVEEEESIRRYRGYVFYKPHGYLELVEHLDRLLHRA